MHRANGLNVVKDILSQPNDKVMRRRSICDSQPVSHAIKIDYDLSRRNDIVGRRLRESRHARNYV